MYPDEDWCEGPYFDSKESCHPYNYGERDYGDSSVEECLDDPPPLELDLESSIGDPNYDEDFFYSD